MTFLTKKENLLLDLMGTAHFIPYYCKKDGLHMSNKETGTNVCPFCKKECETLAQIEKSQQKERLEEIMKMDEDAGMYEN